MPFRRTTTLTWILFGINNYSMITSGKAVIDEVGLIYFTNTMQIIALSYLVYNVFNELLVICQIKMWKIKPKAAASVSTEVTHPPYVNPEQAVYKEMAIMGESNTDTFT